MEQIIRIPIKYSELLNTMSDIEAGKLAKALFLGKDDGLSGLTLTYYNIIIVDINNLHNSVVNGKKGGRPKKERGVLNNKKGGFEKQEPIESKVKESKVKENIYRQFLHLSITQEEFEKLNETYTKESIDDTLDEIENYSKNKSYKSLYLTANKWLKKKTGETQVKKYKFDGMSDQELVDLRIETKGAIQPELRKFNIYVNAKIESQVKTRELLCY